ncbi:PiggyBac transposable element-derived protein 4 [Plakobranchus ocellatus]|uniref:PiggyBac transposable element-derived protein 4 n=1 Tax=Plakobranchus ocellatus TaxID=259542 RepID=A0AAV4DW25_9GAST|nr:PiggyBac transposable element-derived protein 4 [Plakobranchus ocellatus]
MLMSTAHTARTVRTGKRNRRTDELEEKPEIVHEYNKYMKGVDQVDMYLAFYSFNRKTLKWWKRAATHLIHLTRVQAHDLYKKENRGNKNTKSLYDFTLCLISSLLADVAEKKGPSARQHELLRLSHKDNPHFLESIPATDKKLKPTKRCIACCTKGSNERRKETRYQCKQCNGFFF